MSLTLLNPILAALKPQYPTLSDDEIFEVYCANNILVNYDLDDDQIQDGIIDGSRDAGIDAAYVIVNRAILTDDFPFASIKHQVEIELYLIQSKNTEGFKEGPIDKLSSSLPLLLNPKSNVKTLTKAFKAEAVEITQSFLEALQKLAPQFPKVHVKIFYASRGGSPNDTVRAKASALEETLRKLHANVTITFFGAKELYERAALQKRLVKQLPTVGTPLSSANSYVALCKLTDYIQFIRDDDSKLMNRIFEANVRAYQGEVDVNTEIAESIRHPTPGLDFWWLNNGVTVVADEAQFVNQSLVVENPLVVNGLQTSFELDDYAGNLAGDARLILLRVIVEKDRSKRDQIIKATNRQTAIKPSSFHASEPIHLRIEDYLKTKGFYYDRRKNYYKREGKPSNKIITVDRLAQAVLAVLLKEPHVARARPTAAIKDENTYKRLFSEDPSIHPVEMYGALVEILDAVNQYFKKIRSDVEQNVRNNTRFHVLMVLSWAINGNVTLPAKRIVQLDLAKATEKQVKAVCDWVFAQFENAGGEDKVAKGDDFTKLLLKTWSAAKTKV